MGESVFLDKYWKVSTIKCWSYYVICEGHKVIMKLGRTVCIFVFLLKTVYETQLKQISILSKLYFFGVKIVYLTPLKNSSNLHEFQKLSGPLPKNWNQSKYWKLSPM